MAKTCKGCYHWRTLYLSPSCNYALDVGELRGGSADNCNKYETEEEILKGNKISAETKQKIVEAYLSGISAGTIAKTYDLGVSSIYRVIANATTKTYKTAAERVKAEAYTGNVSAKDAARLKKIGEKTGLPVSYNYSEGFGDEENIYAYDGSMSIADFEKRIDMAQKEEPATAATAESSDTEISTPTIIPEEAENVKPRFSEAVKDIVYKAYIARLSECESLDIRIRELNDTRNRLIEQRNYELSEADRLWADYERINND